MLPSIAVPTKDYFVSNIKNHPKGKNLVQFWVDSVEKKNVLQLLVPTPYSFQKNVNEDLNSSVCSSNAIDEGGGHEPPSNVSSAASPQTNEKDNNINTASPVSKENKSNEDNIPLSSGEQGFVCAKRKSPLDADKSDKEARSTEASSYYSIEKLKKVGT